MDGLEKQLKTENKKDAEECIEFYKHLKSTDKDGRVWSSRWEPFTELIFNGYGSRNKIYRLNNTGKTFMAGVRAQAKET